MLISLATIAAGALVLYFWNQIASFLVNVFLPFIREHALPVFGIVAALVDFVNKGVVTVRESIIRGYHWVKENLLHSSTIYTPIEGDMVKGTTRTIINDNGKVSGTETSFTMVKWDMPTEALVALSQRAEGIEVDNKTEILHKAESQAQKQAMSLASAN